jgi:hypothetical protein
MAELNFQPKNDIQVVVGTGSANLGTAHAVSDTWTKLPIVDFSLEQASATLDVAPHRSSTYGQTSNMGRHRPDTQNYEVSLTMRGTPSAVTTSCLALFGDGDSACELKPTNNTGTMKDAVTNASAVTVLFEGAGSDSINTDIIMKSCFATSMTIKEDIGSNGGEMVVEVTLWSAYRPTEGLLAPTTYTSDTATPKNIFDLATKTVDSQDLIIHSWEISISRSLERVGYQDTTDYDPFGYVQTSPYEVTGSITCKRDNEIGDILDHIEGDSTAIALSLAESSGFTLSCPGIMIDNSKPEVGEYLTQTIPFRAFGASETANIISITIA